jgi:hypothetical protein
MCNPQNYNNNKSTSDKKFDTVVTVLKVDKQHWREGPTPTNKMFMPLCYRSDVYYF